MSQIVLFPENHEKQRTQKLPKKLTVARVKAMKPGDKLADPDRPGLRVHAGNKTKRWIYRFKDPRKRYEKTNQKTGEQETHFKLTEQFLGYYPQMSLSDAHDAWSLAKLQRRKGELPEKRATTAHPKEPAPEPQGLTVEALCQRYVQYARHEQKKRSWLMDEKQLWRDLVPRYGRVLATELTRDQVEDMLAEVEERGPRAAQKLLAVVRGMFNVAIRRCRKEGWDRNLLSNPAANIELDRQGIEPAFIKGPVVKRFLRALGTAELDDIYRDAILFQLLTCTRPGEVCALPWSEIDIEGGLWSLPARRAKNSRPHDIFLSRQAVSLLKHLRNAHPDAAWAFPSTRTSDGHIRTDTYAKVLAARRSELHLPDGFSPHSLRHTAVTNLAALGCPKHLRNRMTNHKEQGIDARYQHHEYDAEAREWWQRWSDHLLDDIELGLDNSEG